MYGIINIQKKAEDIMKLAEALILRADLQKRMAQVRQRIYKNVLVQDGEKPSEDPNTLISEFMGLQEKLSNIIKSINKTNNETVFDETMMLYEALVKRDDILSRRNILISAADHASDRQDRYSLTEIKYVSVINVEQFQKEADNLAKEYRKLDTKIQGLNWNTDLI